MTWSGGGNLTKESLRIEGLIYGVTGMLPSSRRNLVSHRRRMDDARARSRRETVDRTPFIKDESQIRRSAQARGMTPRPMAKEWARAKCVPSGVTRGRAAA